MTLDLSRLTDVELLQRYRKYPGTLLGRSAEVELERRLRRDGGWLSSNDVIYLPREGGGIDVVPFKRLSEVPSNKLSKQRNDSRVGRVVDLRTTFHWRR